MLHEQRAAINTIADLHRAHYGQLVASITRVCGDISSAEDVVQDAFLAASNTWKDGELPENAVGWLMQTAKNKAIDQLRRNKRWAEKSVLLQADEDIVAAQEPPDVSLLSDDMARLIFTCCHPALHIDARVALSLSVVCGLRTEEIARAFIVTEATMSQRLWRAKSKIRDAGIGYKVPDDAELPDRLNGVLAVIYLIFNEGWLASSGAAAIRLALVEEAIRLARLIAPLETTTRDSKALLALMLLQHSRRDARFDAEGNLVLLGDQDRKLWRANEIEQGLELLHSVFSAGQGYSRYALMAAIASVHAQATTAEQTDWDEVVRLYGYLQDLDPSAVVALNLAVAVGERDGAEQGLAAIDALQESATLKRYYLYHSSRAEFLRRLGRDKMSQKAYEMALKYCTSEVERNFLSAQLEKLLKSSGFS